MIIKICLIVLRPLVLGLEMMKLNRLRLLRCYILVLYIGLQLPNTCANMQFLRKDASLQPKTKSSEPSSELDSLSESDEDVVYDSSKIFSNISERDLDEIRNKFNILVEIELVCPR